MAGGLNVPTTCYSKTEMLFYLCDCIQVDTRPAIGWQAPDLNGLLHYGMRIIIMMIIIIIIRWSSGQRVQLLMMRSRVRSPALPQILNVD